MAIEFPCPSCHKQLYVANTYAGLEARCPGCGKVTSVPGERPPQQQFQSQQPHTFVPPLPSPTDSAEVNPFAPTGQLSYVGQWQTAEEDALERSGPPWERDGISVGSYFATGWQCLTGPNDFFRTMRRDGGIGYPMLYAWLTCMIATFSYVATIFVLFALMAVPERGLLLIVFVVGSLIAPMMMVVGVLFNALICHGMLKLLGGAKQPVLATYRALLYASGGAFLLGMFPMCGFYLAGTAQIVLFVIGLARTHEIGIGRAAAAVFLPAVLVVGLAMIVD